MRDSESGDLPLGVTRVAASLPDQVTTVLVRLLAGWRPDPFRAAGSGHLNWNDGELEASITQAYEEQGRLVLECTTTGQIVHEFITGDIRNKPCTGTVDIGLNFEAQSSHAEGFTNETARFECFYWNVSQVRSTDKQPQLWFAPLGEIKSWWRLFTNAILKVSVTEPDSGDVTTHMTSLLHLRADYDYYVLAPCRGSKDTLLLIDTRIGGPPEKKTLHREFSVLQFILGQRLHLGAVAGLDDTGDVVSFSGGPYGTILRKEPYNLHQPQYPLGDNLEPSVARLAGQYAAALFRRACLTERDHPEYGLRAALTFYLTSIGEHLEGAALKLHVALEGLASKMFDVEAEASEHAGGDSTDRATALRESAALYLTTRHADWKAWCKARAGEVRAMTRPEVKDAVLDAIRRADRPGASQIVPTMLKHYGIPARSEIDRVLAARNELVHEARLPAEDNFDRLIEHQSIPRTLLVALVARVVAYTGPIIGYNPRSFDWWSLAGDLGEGENISYRAIATLDATEWRALGREGLDT